MIKEELENHKDIKIEDEVRLVSVRIQGQLVGLPISAVRDVFSIHSITPVPRADPIVTGLVNLRGHIVTILDLGYLLSFKIYKANPGQEPMVVGVEWQGEVFGLVVDEIGDVLSLYPDSSEDIIPNMSSNWARFTQRIHKLEKELMVEIDLNALLASVVLQAA